MATIIQLKHLVSKLSQRRYYLEKGIENIPKMLPACLILRYRATGTRDFQSIKRRSKSPFGKSYAYLTYLEGGVTRHKYIPKKEIDKIAKVTEPYRVFCEKMAHIRALNKRILEVLDRIGEIQKEEVKKYVSKRTERSGKKKGTK